MSMTREEFLKQHPDAREVETGAPAAGTMSIEDFLRDHPDAEQLETVPQTQSQPARTGYTFKSSEVSDLRKQLGNLPEGFIDIEQLSKELKGFDLDRLGLSQMGHPIPAPQSAFIDIANFLNGLGLDPEVNYRDGAPVSFRVSFGGLDTDDERIAFIEKTFGKGAAGRDPAGRWTFLNPETGVRHTVDDLDVTMKDVADSLMHVPEIAGMVTAAILTRGQTLGRQIVSEVVGGLLGMTTAELAEDLEGLQLETPAQIQSRLSKEAFFLTGLSVVSRVPGVIVNRIKSPLSGGLTRETRQLARDVDALNAMRVQQGLSEIRLRPSALNESPALARFEGILAKFPGSAGVFQKNQSLLKEAIDDEVKILTAGLPDKDVVAPVIRKRLWDMVNDKLDAAREASNARFTGVDPSTGGRATVEGTEFALATRKANSQKLIASLEARVGDQEFVPTEPLAAAAKQLRNEAVRDMDGEVIEAFTPGISIARLAQLDKLPKFLTLAQAQRIRTSLGDMISGRQPLSDLTEGQAKFLYKALNESMDEKNIKNWWKDMDLTFQERRQFALEYRQFNEQWRALHEDFNVGRSPMNQILRRFKNEPEKLVEFYFRRNNASNINRIKSTIPAREFEKFQAAAQDVLLTNKTGKQLESVLNRMDDETLVATFGREKVTDFRNFAVAARELEETPLQAFMSERDEAVKLMTEMIKPENPATAFRARDLLGRDSPDWFKIQLAFAEKLLRESTDKGVLNGGALTNMIDRKFGQRTVQRIFEGTDLYNNLRLVANIAEKGTKAEGSAAGGLAAGLFMLNLVRTANVITGGTIAGTAWLLAKGLTSKSAKTWLTNEPISNTTRTGLRAMTQTLLFVSAQPEKSASERVAPAKQLMQDAVRELGERTGFLNEAQLPEE